MFLPALLSTSLLLPTASFACTKEVADRYAPLARPHSRYLAITKIPITSVAAMMQRPTLEMPRWTGSEVQWEEPMFRWVNERWRDRNLSRLQTAAEPRDAVVALFDLALLDEGWFELRCPHGQVPGEERGFRDYDTTHLEQGALRVNAGVAYDTAAEGFRAFREARGAFFSFLSAGASLNTQAMIFEALGNRERARELSAMSALQDELSVPPPSTEAMWRHLVGFVVHPRSRHRDELREQIRRGRAGTRQFGDRDLYRELSVVPFE